MNCGTALLASARPFGDEPGKAGPSWDIPTGSSGEADRRRQIERTRMGLIFLVLGAVVPWLPLVGIFGGVLTLAGAVLVIVGRKAFGAAHRRNVLIAISLFLLGYLVVFVGGIEAGISASRALSNSTTEAEVAEAAWNIIMSLLLFAAIGSIFAGLASVFFTYDLQTVEGHFLLWAAYAATVGIQIAILLVTIPMAPLIAATIANEVSLGDSVDLAEIASAVTTATGGLRLLFVVPSLIYALVYFLAWSRISGEEISISKIPSEGIPPSPSSAPRNPR